MSDHGDGSAALLRPGATCWRRARAGRVGLLHDGAAYFAAAHSALLKARRSILLIGWSLDPRVRLTPDREGPEGRETFAELLRRLKANRPDLAIRLLVWPMPWPLSAGNDLDPERTRALLGPEIDYRTDTSLSFGACHHQKILVIDDRIAFCGGSDFEANRWDTPAHRDRDPRRRLPNGEDYPPRHDVMMLVDGPAAAALGAVARGRWRDGTGEALDPPREATAPAADPWPEGIVPILADVEVGLSRTVPAGRGPAVRESEALYLAAIRAARRTIYLENQYFTAPVIARALAERLAEPEGPEIVVVLSECSPNAFDRLTMDSARRGLIRRLRAQDRHDRLRIVSPHTPRHRPILMHSKVAIIDERLLRVGSTNLNNRSFGYDTECDLSVELPLGAPEGAVVTRVLHGLLAHHAGMPRAAFEAAVAERGSLRAALDDGALISRERLCRVVASRRGPVARLVEAWHLGDPTGLGDAWRPWRRPRALRAETAEVSAAALGVRPLTGGSAET